MRNHLLRLIGATAIASVVLAVTPAATAAEPDPLLGAPKSGTCYDVSGRSAEEKSALAQPTSPCAKRHTLWVAGSAEMPADAVLDYDATGTLALVVDLCKPLWTDLVGEYGTRAFARSAYVGYTFFPTKAQQREGAHWVSCAIGIAAGDGRLTSSTRKKPVQIKASLPQKLSLCGTRAYEFTNCAAPHAYRPVHAQQVRFKGAYNTTKRDRHAIRVCDRYSDADDFMWAARGLTAHRYVLVCLNKNRR